MLSLSRALLVSVRAPVVTRSFVRRATAFSLSSSHAKYYSQQRSLRTPTAQALQSNETNSRSADAHQSGANDLILSDLISAAQVDDLLKVVEQHHPVMNNKHILTSFEILSYKVERKDMSAESVTATPAFQSLATRALKRMRFYEPGDCLTLLKCASLLKMSPESALVQGILQVIRLTLNQLYLEQQAFLYYVLNKFKECTVLAEALKTAIPIVFQAQCCTQLDTTNSSECFRALRFCLSVNMDKATIEYVSSALQRHCSRLSAGQIMTIIGASSSSPTLFNINELPAFKELLDSCVDALAGELHKLDDKAVRRVLGVVGQTTFSKSLFDSLWSLATTRDWPLGQVCQLAAASLRKRYLSLTDARAVVDRVAENPSMVLDDPAVSVAAISHVLAYVWAQSMKVSDAQFQKAVDVLGSATTKTDQISASPSVFVPHLRNLLVLDVAHPDQVSNFFRQDYQKLVEDRLRSTGSKGGLPLVISEIVQYARYRFGEESASEFSLTPGLRNLVQRAVERSFISYRPLEDCLAEAFGGEQFIREGITTQWGTWIDYLVVMGPGGFPVSLSERTSSNFNDLFGEIPRDSKVVPVILTDESAYMYRTGLSSVSLSAKLDLLRAQKLCPLLINIEKWKCLLEHERVPMIMRDLKAVLETGEVYSSICRTQANV